MNEDTPLKSHEKRTVDTLLDSSNSQDYNEADVFLRKLWALLVFQYGSILFLSSPFALIRPFQELIHPYHDILEGVAICGIVASLVLAVTKGKTYPLAHVALVSLTVFVALEMGLTFSNAGIWGYCGHVALGQATTSFAIIRSVLQFEKQDLLWLSYKTAALMCLCLSGLWMIVQAEMGVSWSVAVGISLGGLGFTVMVLFCCSVICKNVTSDEYILAVLFILVPEALLCVSGKQHKTATEIERQSDYGGV